MKLKIFTTLYFILSLFLIFFVVINYNESYVISSISFNILAAVTCGFLFLIYKFYKKDNNINLNQSLDLNIINQFNSGQLNSIIKASVVLSNDYCQSSVVSLLIKLSHEGYIKLEINSETFVVTKIKEYDGKDEILKNTLDILFENDKIDYINFYDESFEFSKNIYNKFQKIENLMSKTSEKKVKVCEKNIYFIVLFSIILFTLEFFYIFKSVNIFDIFNTTSSIVALFLLIIFDSIWIFVIALSYTDPVNRKDNIKAASISSIFIVGGVYSSLLFFIMKEKSLIDILFIALSLGITVLIPLLVNFTEEGKVLYAKIMIFEKFLKNITEDEAKNLLKENSNIFWVMLPYSFVFESSKKWIQIFSHIGYYIESKDSLSYESLNYLSKYEDDISNIIPGFEEYQEYIRRRDETND